MTFSIVAWDPDAHPSPEWGVAVASKFLAVGAVVPWARAGVGAIATQALANLAYGPKGLAHLEQGSDASSVVAGLTGADPQRDHRQLGVVDAAGRAASFTGTGCLDWAGGTVGHGYCCQGNILVGPRVVTSMRDAFEASAGELATRLLKALEAGDDAGGDRRGRQSASLLVVREGGGYGGGIDKAVDLRIDDHAEPVAEIRRLFEIHRLVFPRPEDLRFVEVDAGVAEQMRSALTALGYDAGAGHGFDAGLRRALFDFVGTENLEERWSDDDAMVDRGVIDYLLGEAPSGPRGVS